MKRFEPATCGMANSSASAHIYHTSHQRYCSAARSLRVMGKVRKRRKTPTTDLKISLSKNSTENSRVIGEARMKITLDGKLVYKEYSSKFKTRS